MLIETGPRSFAGRSLFHHPRDMLGIVFDLCTKRSSGITPFRDIVKWLAGGQTNLYISDSVWPVQAGHQSGAILALDVGVMSQGNYCRQGASEG